MFCVAAAQIDTLKMFLEAFCLNVYDLGRIDIWEIFDKIELIWQTGHEGLPQFNDLGFFLWRNALLCTFEHAEYCPVSMKSVQSVFMGHDSSSSVKAT